MTNPFKALVGLFALLGTWAHAATESVSFPGAKGEGYPHAEVVTATWQTPSQGAGPWPAVAIFHGSAGIDGRGAFHAKALHVAGIATLEVHMFDQGKRFREGHTSTLTHAYGALQYLSNRPDVVPAQIGAMGFSWGGNLSLRAASKVVHQRFFPNGGPQFAGHAAFYAVWWQHQRLLAEPSARGYGDYADFTGAPVMLLAGGKDDYGDPQDAQSFLNALTPSQQQLFKLQHYPGGTHGWDVPSGAGRTVYDPTAGKGKGGHVRMFPDPGIAEQSRQAVVDFFRQAFKTPR